MQAPASSCCHRNEEEVPISGWLEGPTLWTASLVCLEEVEEL